VRLLDRTQSPPYVLFVGSRRLLECMVGHLHLPGYRISQLAAYNDRELEEALSERPLGQPRLAVVIDPSRYAGGLVERLPGRRIGIVADNDLADQRPEGVRACELLLSFDPRREWVGGVKVWRAMSPPVSDSFFVPKVVAPRHPAAVTVGRSTPYREEVLIEAKHHYDLLQIIEGVSAEELTTFFRDHPVAVYVPRYPGGGPAWQIAAHLAAGQLLLSERAPTMFGLEEDVDYVAVKDGNHIMRLLEALSRFPTMFTRVAIRGRQKAEWFRASRVWQRLIDDALLWFATAEDPLSFAGQRRSVPH